MIQWGSTQCIDVELIHFFLSCKDIKGYIEIIYDYQIEKCYTAVTKTEFDNINPCQQIKVCLACNDIHDQYIFGF